MTLEPISTTLSLLSIMESSLIKAILLLEKLRSRATIYISSYINWSVVFLLLDRAKRSDCGTAFVLYIELMLHIKTKLIKCNYVESFPTIFDSARTYCTSLLHAHIHYMFILIKTILVRILAPNYSVGPSFLLTLANSAQNEMKSPHLSKTKTASRLLCNTERLEIHILATYK